MAGTWGLLPIALLALCWGPGAAGSQETVPLQTLRCYNNYTSHITCQWADTQAAQSLVNLTLYRRLNDEDPQPVPCELGNSLPWSDCPVSHCVPRNCSIPYKGFVIADRDYYSFQPDRPLVSQRTFTLAQHVQPPAPQDLRINGSGDALELSWSVALGGPRGSWLSQSDLEFEVVYRRLQDSWEEAPTLLSSSPQAMLGPELLVPSSSYVARVRARLAPGSGFSGRPSEWSPEVRWNSPPGDEAQPRNLQCLFNGADLLSCSWEVRAEVTSSLSFTLSYKASPDAGEEECAPVLVEKPEGPYTRHRCQIPVADPWAHGQYTVSVHPKKEEKPIKSSENIQMEPPDLNVTNDRGSYSLHWSAKKLFYNHIEYTFQVQYRKEAATWEKSKTETLQNTHSMSLTPLEPSTTYLARARVRVKPTSGGYNGPWSEWSEEYTWTTEWAFTPLSRPGCPGSSACVGAGAHPGHADARLGPGAPLLRHVRLQAEPEVGGENPQPQQKPPVPGRALRAAAAGWGGGSGLSLLPAGASVPTPSFPSPWVWRGGGALRGQQCRSRAPAANKPALPAGSSRWSRSRRLEGRDAFSWGGEAGGV